jgi:hypothetical protein
MQRRSKGAVGGEGGRKSEGFREGWLFCKTGLGRLRSVVVSGGSAEIGIFFCVGGKLGPPHRFNLWRAVSTTGPVRSGSEGTKVLAFAHVPLKQRLIGPSFRQWREYDTSQSY